MAVAEDCFLAGVVADGGEEGGRQVELLSVHDVLAERDCAHIASNGLELLLEERGHAEHILAIARISAHTVTTE